MRVGVFICGCGGDVSDTVDVEKLVNHSKKLDCVIVARNHDFLCLDGLKLIEEDIKENKLDAVVIAACDLYQQTFRAAIEEAGLNPFCLEMANIREHCSWVHKDKEKATQKAK
ncbi:disulfide reductase, partial [Archaeoglobales archaeon]